MNLLTFASLGGEKTLQGLEGVEVGGLVDVLAVRVRGNGVQFIVIYTTSDTNGEHVYTYNTWN